MFGNYTVAFERDVEVLVNGTIGPVSNVSRDVHTITYDSLTNVAGPERSNVAQNSHEEDDNLGAVATFANGNFVTLYDELDHATVFNFDLRSIEFTITNPFTGATVRPATEISESRETATGRALDVAVLTGGQIGRAHV